MGKNSTTCYLWSLKEIIDFIPYLVKIRNLESRQVRKTVDFKIKKKISKYFGHKNNPIVTKYVNRSSSCWTRDEIDEVKDIMAEDIDVKIDNFPEEYCNYLRKTGCTYPKAMNLYKALYIDNKFDSIDNNLISRIMIMLK